MKNLLPTAALVTAISLTGPLAFADSASFQNDAKDAWITGKIETVYTLNRHLSPFRINTDVNGGVVVLSGVVESEIDRDLAGELAKGIEGVTEVNNELQVDAGNSHEAAVADNDGESRRDFGSWVDDATTTAAVKSKLIQNSSTKGLQIDVDTDDDVVTLSGRVETAQVKELAEEIAHNTGDVKAVHNNLVVDPS